MVLPLASCAIGPSSSTDTGFGASPAMPAPESSLVPVVNIAPIQAPPDGFVPTAAAGFVVTQFAGGLAHPRWLYTLPNGDVLVAESDAPHEHDEGSGLFGWIRKQVMKRAGAGVPSPDRIVLLRDVDGSGVARTQAVLLGGLHSPFGMALIGNQLYVADTDALLRFNYVTGTTQITSPGVKVASLPGGPINHHWTKNILADRSGKHLYITVGSNSNAGENGVDSEEGRARVLVFDIETAHVRPYATGFRNTNGLGWQPDSGALWTVVNERDDLGNNLVPDYMTAVKDGAFMALPTATTASTSTPASNHNAPIWLQRPSRRTMRSAIIRLRQVWSFTTGRCSRLVIVEAHLSASMDHGTANRVPAIRWCLCRLSMENLQACLRVSCAAF
ncbi:glucose / Sorbosone dehydrogenase family protein [Paraburkholderia xenovorans LB400]|nr:glucose / Sorbosone dehydrogenase family protein [Paraburkholderia xenovorans LB400]